MRFVLIAVFVVLAILVVRMMFSAQLEKELPSKKNDETKPKRKRKHRRPLSNKQDDAAKAETWVKPKLEEWQPGQPVKGCPNARNEFHECSAYCWQRYSQRPPEMVAMDK